MGYGEETISEVLLKIYGEIMVDFCRLFKWLIGAMIISIILNMWMNVEL